MWKWRGPCEVMCDGNWGGTYTAQPKAGTKRVALAHRSLDLSYQLIDFTETVTHEGIAEEIEIRFHQEKLKSSCVV